MHEDTGPTLTEERWQALTERLARSAFRSRFRLGTREHAYYRDKGVTTIRQHAEDFVRQRLASAQPKNDGKQTPMRGHPVFIAQHATATCCRKCLASWHGIRRGESMSEEAIHYVVDVLMRWLEEKRESQ